MLLLADPYVTERPPALLGLRDILASAVSDLWLDAKTPGFSRPDSLCLVQVRAGWVPQGGREMGHGWLGRGGPQGPRSGGRARQLALQDFSGQEGQHAEGTDNSYG